MGDYHVSLIVTVTCDDNSTVILNTSLDLQGQTILQLLGQAQTQLSAILAELLALNPDCTNFSLRVYDNEAGIDYTVHSSSLLLLVAAAYTELVFALLSL